MGIIPSGGLGRQPNVSPNAKRQNKNQAAKRPLIPLTLLQTAAKRRRESEGIIPSGGLGRQPNVSPPQREASQKRESGNEASPDSANAAYLRFSFRITAPTSSFSLSSIAKKYRHTAYNAAYGAANISTPE